MTRLTYILGLLSATAVACGGDGKGSSSDGSNGSGGSAGEAMDSGGTGGGDGGSSTGGSSTGGGSSGGSNGGGTGGTAGSGGAGGSTSGNGGTAATGTGGGTTGGAGGTTTTGGTGGGGSGGEPAVVPLTLTVVPSDDRRTISAQIYGIDGSANALATKAKLARFGGSPNNDTSGYNWEVNATHLSNCKEDADQYYDNVAMGSGEPGALAAEVLTAAQTNLGAALIPIPIGGIVAADTLAESVIDTPDYLTARFKTNVATKGSEFALDPDTDDDFVYQDEFVNWVKEQAGSTPVVFELDEHPALWEEDVCLIHPTKASYDDVVGSGVEFATAIKNTWPEAEVAGPHSYGWQSFVDLQHSPDVETEGAFLDYYLWAMDQAEDDAGFRLLDYLDVNWYPDIYVNGRRIVEEDDDAEISAARMQAPRSLWDAGYDEGTWISGSAGGPIDLIHRLQASIDDHYPGTKLAITAWYYGGGSHISGAIAAADVLGIFGREGVDLASLTLPTTTAPFAMAAFDVFLDYDGAGAHFGDTSVAAATDDADGASVYASIDAADETKLVIVALNKRTNPRDVSIVIDSSTSYTACSVYELTGESSDISPGTALSVEEDNTFLYQMPPLSVTVLVPQTT